MAENRYPWLMWHSSVPGKWAREIDEAEKFYTTMASHYKGTGRMFFAITGFLSLEVESSEASSAETQRIEDALREAWLRLRHEHPPIASRVEFDVKERKWMKIYETFEEEHLAEQQKAWLRNTVISLSPGVDGLEWCNADPPAPEVPTLFIINTPSHEGLHRGKLRRDLVLRSPHDILDGIGTLHLLNNLLKMAAQAYLEPMSWTAPSPGAELDSLSPPLRVAASIPPILTLGQQTNLQNTIKANAKLRQNVHILTVPFKQGSKTPGKHQRVALHLPAADTAKLLQRSKGLGATVTHLYHAAIAVALRDLQAPQEEERVGRYISYSLINERPNCSGEYSTPKHAAAVYHSVSENHLALDLTIPSIEDVRNRQLVNNHDKQAEYCNLVGQVKTYYQAVRDFPDHLALAPTVFSLSTPDLPTPTSRDPSQIPVPAPNPAPSVSLSSMGVIDKIIAPRHGPFKVSNPWVTGEELGTGLGVFLGSWEGKLSLSAAYNDAWHDREEAERFLERLHQVVCEGLGLDVEIEDS
ncbi:hypothetical protein ACN47E_006611 [Coniothyrium glycines]